MAYINKRRIGKPNHKDENNQRRNKKWSKYYGDKRWKRLREWQITNFTLCQDCAVNGISRPATECHHIVPFSRGLTEEEKWQLLLDPDNIVSLCSECHDKRHAILNHNQQ